MDDTGSGLSAGVLAAYRQRLGVDANPPSADALSELMRRHVERVPYETMWIHMGDLWNVDPMESARRIATSDRGGYCFHLNGGFSALLAALGYDVRRHVGGVHGPDGPDPNSLTNHLVLTVHDLPTEANPAGDWYVDVGLGDALYEPLPLYAGQFQQGPFTIGLEHNALAAVDRVGDWHLQHDPTGVFVGMNWCDAAVDMSEFQERNTVLATSPDSNFAKVAIAMRRDATGVDIMRGLMLARLGDGEPQPVFLTERDDWFAALADIFGLTFAQVTPERVDMLWSRVHETHAVWAARF